MLSRDDGPVQQFIEPSGARELQSRYEKDERGADEWRWEVHHILFGQSALLRQDPN